LKKKKNIWILWLAILLLLMAQLKKEGVLEDHMVIYDDFDTTTGIDYSKWDYGVVYGHMYNGYNYFDNPPHADPEIHYDINGNIFLGAHCWGGQGQTEYHTAGALFSKRLWTTENLKMRVSSYWEDTGDNDDCNTYPWISFGDSGNLIKKMTRYQSGQTTTTNGIIEIKRYDDLDLTKYVVVVDGQEAYLEDNTEPVNLKLVGGMLWVDFVKYAPYMSCEIDYTNEVVVRDKFAEGSTVNMTTLTYTPLKFCPQDLGVLRFTEQGLTDELGSLTEAVARGKSLVVPAGEYWQYDYVTEYVTNMTERCGVGFAYDTSLEECVSVASQQIPTNVLLYCEEDADCVVPPNCHDATVSCVDNQCDYNSSVCTMEQIINYISVIEALDLEQPEVILLNNGSIKVRFVADETVAGELFEATIPSPQKQKTECQVSEGYLSPLKEGCYKTVVDWGDYLFNIENGEEKKINDYVTVKYIMGGKGVYNGIKSAKREMPPDGNCERQDISFDYEWVAEGDCYPEKDYENIFEVTFTDVIDITDATYTEKVALGSNNIAKVSIKNNIFPLNDAGFTVQFSKGLRDIYLPSSTTDANFASGESDYNVNMLSDELGTYTMEIIPFFNIVGNQFYQFKKIAISYYVGQETFDCSVYGCTIGECQPDVSCLVDSGGFIEDIYTAPSTPVEREEQTFILLFIGAMVIFLLMMRGK
jgi:hypothetical protein